MTTDNSMELIAPPSQSADTSIVPQVSNGLRRLSILDLTESQFNRLQILADYVSKSQMSLAKLNNNALSPADVMLIFLEGLSLGMSEMSALKSIDLISGKPTLDAQGMLGLIYASKLLESIEIDAQDDHCTVTMKRVGQPVHSETYSMADAHRMGITNKQNWKVQPRTMLKWRAVAACSRIVFPDIIQGMYTPEEMEGVSDAQPPTPTRVERPVPPSLPPVPPPRAQISAGSGDETVIETPQSASHWLSITANQQELTALLNELGLKASEVLSQIEPGRALTRWTETILDKTALFAKLREIGASSHESAASEPPAKPRYGGQPAAKPDYSAALIDRARQYFGILEEEIAELCGQSWRTAYDGLEAAWRALCKATMLKPEDYPIYVSQIIYRLATGKVQAHIEFVGPHSLILFGRSTKFKAMVGDDYYARCGAADWDKQAVDEDGKPIVHDVDELIVRWTVKDGKPVVKDVEPLPDLPDDATADDDAPEAVDLAAVFPR